MRNCYGRTEKSEKALWVSEKVLTGIEGVCCGGKENGEYCIMRDRVVRGKRTVLMSTEELSRLVYNTKCSHSRRNACGRKFTSRIEFYRRIQPGGDCR